MTFFYPISYPVVIGSNASWINNNKTLRISVKTTTGRKLHKMEYLQFSISSLIRDINQDYLSDDLEFYAYSELPNIKVSLNKYWLDYEDGVNDNNNKSPHDKDPKYDVYFLHFGAMIGRLNSQFYPDFSDDLYLAQKDLVESGEYTNANYELFDEKINDIFEQIDYGYGFLEFDYWNDLFNTINDQFIDNMRITYNTVKYHYGDKDEYNRKINQRKIGSLFKKHFNIKGCIGGHCIDLHNVLGGSPELKELLNYSNFYGFGNNKEINEPLFTYEDEFLDDIVIEVILY